MKTPRALTIRKWLALAWLSYALLPGVALGLAYGVAYLLLRRDPGHDNTVFPILITFAVSVQVSVPVAVGLFMGRSVLRPLAAMSRASRAIARGNLSFALPPSRVREVVEVSTAFGTMAHDLRAALARQADLEEERRFFVAAVAHDLRTPLFSLRGYLEGLSTGVAGTPERAAHYIAVSQEKADELEHLIADLFAYTQVERLEQRAHHEPADLSQLLARAVESVRPQAEAKSVTLTLGEPDAPALIEGDAHLLTRAVANLLDNALRHTPAGGAVDVCLRAAPERWILTVVDTGPGFDARDLPHLFEPLYRGEASRSRQTGGSGMGLTIARRILRAHGGDLTAANHSTGGAELTGCVARAVTNL